MWKTFHPSCQQTMVGEWMGRLFVEQHIGDHALDILNPIIGQIFFFSIIFILNFFENSYLPHRVQIGVIFTLLDFFYKDLQIRKCVEILNITSFGGPKAIFPIL